MSDQLVPVTATLLMICGYTMFSLFAACHPQPQTAKRWRVSILAGILQGFLILGTFGLIVIGNSPGITVTNWITALRQAFVSFTLITCLAMPFVSMATFGMYVGFVQTGDVWLEQIWEGWHLKRWLGKDLPDAQSIAH